jgi:anion-transporting  ArsA/GET3 family ATPase
MSQASAEDLPDALIRQQLLFVTGKGGVGKSAVATAFATAAARAGRRSLLVVQQPPGTVHPQLGLAPGYRPANVETNLDLCNIDGRSALKEYVQRSMPMHTLYDWFLDTRAIKHFTEAAPGFDELMCLGKLYDLVTESDYALVVFDAPATGHAALMLRVPRTTAAAVRSGPLHTNAVKIQRLLEDHVRSCVIVVALAEEMAVREALELSSYVDGELGIAVGPTIVNRVTSQLFTAAEIAALSSLPDPSAALARMTRAAEARFARAAVEAQHIESLRAERPWLTDVPNIVLARHDGAALIDGMVARLRETLVGSHD